MHKFIHQDQHTFVSLTIIALLSDFRTGVGGGVIGINPQLSSKSLRGLRSFSSVAGLKDLEAGWQDILEGR